MSPLKPIWATFEAIDEKNESRKSRATVPLKTIHAFKQFSSYSNLKNPSQKFHYFIQ
jgi:hypothetical protein